MKHLYLFIFILLGLACNIETNTSTASKSDTYHAIQGKTMGTTYSVKYLGENPEKMKTEIDQLLVDINQEVSTYIKDATISIFNNNEITELDISDKPHFRQNIEAAKDIVEKTKGAFDPTIMPLVNYWGFGYTEKRKVTNVDSLKIDSLMQSVGFDNISLVNNILEKENPDTQLDFSAIAKGYGVDAIGKLLEQQKVDHYFVEIGGETLAKGKNPKGQNWRIGINVPEENASTQEFYSIIKLANKGLATSGNYRNFYKSNDQKYGHTINTKTGFPEINTTLSASVIANDCMTADAYATAFMVMGYEEALKLVETIPDVETYLIYATDEATLAAKQSSGMQQYILE